MKELFNIIEQTMNSSQQRAVATNSKDKRDDQAFQLTMLAIATILVSLLEWIY